MNFEFCRFTYGSSWFVLGQIFASIALDELNKTDPYDFRTPIYTQVCFLEEDLCSNKCQWAMIGATIIIFLFLPESPWWLVSKNKHDKAKRILEGFHGKVPGYNVQEQIVCSKCFIFSVY